MSHHRSRLVHFAAGAGALTLATGLTLGATSALAVPFPATSTATSSGDHLKDLMTEPHDVVDDLAEHLTGSTGTTGTSGSGTSGTGSTGTGSTSPDGGSGSGGGAPLAPIGSGLKEVLGKAEQGTKDTPLAPVVPAPAPGGVLKLSLNAAPLATACAQVTGSGTAVANLDVTVGGHDVSTPLIEALPGLLAPCPSGSTPKTNGADAAVSELVGACVRVTAEPPLRASLLVLDHELVAELTKAGLPLDRLVVPCPATDGTGDGTGPGGGTDEDDTQDTNQDNGAGHGDDQNGKGGSDDNGGAGQGSDDDCAPTVNAQNTAGIVPTSAPQALPWILLALALLGRKRLAQVAALVRPRKADAGR